MLETGPAKAFLTILVGELSGLSITLAIVEDESLLFVDKVFSYIFS